MEKTVSNERKFKQTQILTANISQVAKSIRRDCFEQTDASNIQQFFER